MFMLKPQQELDFAKKIYEQELSILELKKKNLTLEAENHDLNSLLEAHKSLIEKIEQMVPSANKQ